MKPSLLTASLLCCASACATVRSSMHQTSDMERLAEREGSAMTATQRQVQNALVTRRYQSLRPALADNAVLIIGRDTTRTADAIVSRLTQLDTLAVTGVRFTGDDQFVCANRSHATGRVVLLQQPDSTGLARSLAYAFAAEWARDSSGTMRIVTLAVGRRLDDDLTRHLTPCPSLWQAIRVRRAFAVTVTPLGPQFDAGMRHDMSSAASAQGWQSTSLKVPRVQRIGRLDDAMAVGAVLVTAQMRVAPYTLEVGTTVLPVQGSTFSYRADQNSGLTQTYEEREVFGVASWSRPRYRIGAGPTFVATKTANTEEYMGQPQAGTWPNPHQFMGPYIATGGAFGLAVHGGVTLLSTRTDFVEIVGHLRKTSAITLPTGAQYSGGSASTGAWLGLSVGHAF